MDGKKKRVWMVNFAAYLLLADGSESKSWLPAPADGLHALQQASECQTAEISTINAANQFITGRGFPSERYYRSASVCSSNR